VNTVVVFHKVRSGSIAKRFAVTCHNSSDMKAIPSLSPITLLPTSKDGKAIQKHKPAFWGQLYVLGGNLLMVNAMIL